MCRSGELMIIGLKSCYDCDFTYQLEEDIGAVIIKKYLMYSKLTFVCVCVGYVSGTQ